MRDLLKFLIILLLLAVTVWFNPAFATSPSWIVEVTRGRVSLETAELISSEIYKQSLVYDVDPNTIFRIITVESMFNPRAVSNKNARGLMQVVPKYHRHRYRGENIHNVEVNIRVGVEIYAEFTQSRYCGGDPKCGLRRYYGALNSNTYANKVLAVRLPIQQEQPATEPLPEVSVCQHPNYLDHDIEVLSECEQTQSHIIAVTSTKGSL